ncbi:MAG: DNA-directed RNA polymerase subunit omega [Lachnospiraceae bacterium]|nr:DNA-directed RNA polymerase subunit omega [Lachnospiraceae bacterium]
MLHPSYGDLMKAVNSEVEEGEAPIVNSRYSIVLATAKRARQLISGDDPLVFPKGRKPLAVAIDELYQGELKIANSDEEMDNVEGAAEESVKASDSQTDHVDISEAGTEQGQDSANEAAAEQEQDSANEAATEQSLNLADKEEAKAEVIEDIADSEDEADEVVEAEVTAEEAAAAEAIEEAEGGSEAPEDNA